ncbi:MAG: hypothetical protein U5K54_20985 [Cytophagales bacterium]|nr:hypothetical protein [Cytophagales bacterium]
MIINGGDTNGSGTVYGKRSSRSSEFEQCCYNWQPTNGQVVPHKVTPVVSSGRVAGDPNAGSYYQRGWRTNPDTNSIGFYRGIMVEHPIILVMYGKTEAAIPILPG